MLTAAVAAAVAVLGVSPVFAAADGLYGTINRFYDTGLEEAASTAAGTLKNALTDVTGAGSTGSGSASYGGTNTGGSKINGKPVIKYYPIGHEETRTITEGGSQGQSSSSDDDELGEASGSASIDYDDVNYDIRISGGKVRLETDEDSYSKDVPSGGTGKVKFSTDHEKVVVNIKEESFTVTIADDKKVRRTLTRTKKNSSSTTAATAPTTRTVTEFVKDIDPLESDPIGPELNAVSLAETYHENYEVYEERMNGEYAIYTNIANGTITNRAVIFDVPEGVVVRLTRDGRDVGFSNKTRIEAEGTYVAYFYVAQDDAEQIPAWAQSLDRAMFNFRIQYASLGGERLEAEARSELESFADLINEEASEFDMDSVSADGVYEPGIPVALQEEAAQEAADAALEALFEGGELFVTEYDAVTGYYKTTLQTGDSFYSNVPDGMVTNGSVVFTQNETIRYELYRDGQAEEYSAGDYITLPGSYILIPVIDNLDYEEYYRVNRPMMHFRIIQGKTRELSLFSAPDCCTIEAVRHDFEDVTKTAMITPSVADLREDGYYEVDIRSEAGTVTLALNRDTQAPMADVRTQPNLAEIAYLSADIADAKLERGSEIITQGSDMPSKVTSPGRYTLTLTDEAGNATIYEFSVDYRINVYAIFAIVMIIVIIAAVVIFIKRAQTKVRVR